MKHLYFVRHGLSEANKAGIWSGYFNTPLASEGHEQAKLAGKLAREQGLVFDIILSSPLDRAHHTAQHISHATGYPISDIVLYDNLIERNFGELENTQNKEAAAKYAQDESTIDAYNNVERLVDLQWRAKEVLKYLHTLPHDTVLVVAHGAFGRALRRAVNNDPLNSQFVAIQNAEIIKFI
ncbi:histidine phosphatase family protein [bacterium]|nr:histidine phosphatase family protein [bacterium]NBX98494.1 histidine phosphatase family protein [bacterium]NDC95514.1 histidine phosphatase family protein [bacterium]NDD84352.1 histidine phosphatase family protein [bacterium]NDG31360.1 histidine phosphatase family protein [bacterium]